MHETQIECTSGKSQIFNVKCLQIWDKNANAHFRRKNSQKFSKLLTFNKKVWENSTKSPRCPSNHVQTQNLNEEKIKNET